MIGRPFADQSVFRPAFAFAFETEQPHLAHQVAELPAGTETMGLSSAIGPAQHSQKRACHKSNPWILMETETCLVAQSDAGWCRNHPLTYHSPFPQNGVLWRDHEPL
jgi:hypothetical protein